MTVESLGRDITHTYVISSFLLKTANKKKTAETSRRSGLLCSRGYLDYVCVSCPHLREFKCRYSLTKHAPLDSWRCEQSIKTTVQKRIQLGPVSLIKSVFLNHSLLPSQTFTSPIPILHKWFFRWGKGLVPPPLYVFSFRIHCLRQVSWLAMPLFILNVSVLKRLR